MTSNVRGSQTTEAVGAFSSPARLAYISPHGSGGEARDSLINAICIKGMGACNHLE